MCTLIVDWSEKGYIVGANRDEVLDRQCDDNFTKKNSGETHGVHYFSPTDLKGGTWFGVNNKHLFSAITNAPWGKPINNWSFKNENPKLGMSRGMLPVKALEAGTEESALTLVLHLLVGFTFKPFNLVIGGKKSCWLIKGDGCKRFSVEPMMGKYIITADWPIAGPVFEKSYSIHRLDYIAKNITNYCTRIGGTDWYKSDGVDKIYNILKYRADDRVQNAVCVYDLNETHRTRSSCILSYDGVKKPRLLWTDTMPDVSPADEWFTL
jgi:hypothetical protein